MGGRLPLHTAVNGSTSVHPFGAGTAVPPGRDLRVSAAVAQLQEAAQQLGAAAGSVGGDGPGADTGLAASERRQKLRELVAASPDELADWLWAAIVKAAPDAAAAVTAAPALPPTSSDNYGNASTATLGYATGFPTQQQPRSRQAKLTAADGVTTPAPGSSETWEVAAARSLPHQLTPEEEGAFTRDGFFVVPNALPPTEVARLLEASADLDRRFRTRMGIGETERLDLLDAMGCHESLLPLLDWPTVFPKVWGLLGWNIAMYHSQISIQPPLPATAHRAGLGWHRDSGRLNAELDGHPARVSVKVGFFLHDTDDSTGFTCVPGSHRPDGPLCRRFDVPKTGSSGHATDRDPLARSIQLRAGDAIVFDRRILHAAVENWSHETRESIFLGYSYRWLRPRDDMSIARYLPRCSAVRRQLLGAAPTGGMGWTSPQDVDVPLRGWMTAHGVDIARAEALVQVQPTPYATPRL